VIPTACGRAERGIKNPCANAMVNFGILLSIGCHDEHRSIAKVCECGAYGIYDAESCCVVGNNLVLALGDEQGAEIPTEKVFEIYYCETKGMVTISILDEDQAFVKVTCTVRVLGLIFSERFQQQEFLQAF
jgi:hypothetical protein